MVTPTRRPRSRPRSRPRPAARRRPAFSLRQLTFCFGLVAICVLGIGLMLRSSLDAASRHPVAALLVGLLLAALVIGVVRARSRSRSRMRAGGVRRPVVPVDEIPAEERARFIVAEAPGEPSSPGLATAAEPEFVVDDADPAEEPVYVEDYTRMEAEEFENAVAALCERDGCRDVRVVGGANDLGADIVATAPDGRTLVIQCKRYADSHKVGSQDLQRFGGTCFAVHGAEVAALVTTSTFTDPAIEYAEQCGILCFTGTDLSAWSTGTGPAPWD
ncbi:restriction endonuclease [Streptomyces sp. Ru73]|uniref:restriction endonuclease n=1 Tax=Streptomyces sp. Ru73 TaxID=2080748 RepID=UPI000CDD64BD|nr:restriction endonuclease [Streptomyces sp. Ru73]POX37429.1 restriction endonuclease [Streptomyces sp. Ru73]